MSRWTGAWLAWGTWALTLPVSLLTLLFSLRNEPSSSSWDTLLLPVVILAFATVGALVASSRPENAIGWLFLSGAFLWTAGELALEYGVYALITDPKALPAGAWAAWFGAWARGIGWFLIVTFLLLLFPTGTLPSSRWRPVLWGTVGLVVVYTFSAWLSPESNDVRLAPVSNPTGLELEPMGVLYELANSVFPLLIVASGAAVIVRFRRSTGDERQQLKWFTYAVMVMTVVFVFWFSLALTGIVAPSSLMYDVPIIGLPVATGIAVLKHRLYDIDIIINRALVYSVLTISLILVYVGGVAGTQTVFRFLTGQDQQPQLAVVASTLAIAALFNPLRRRVQRLVDRRFYRSKYDAAKTLERFGVRLRDEMDLDTLRNDLVSVVEETVQPAHVSLWLKETERKA